MVKSYGMSEKVGFRVYSSPENPEIHASKEEYSPNTTELIDSEVKRLLEVNVLIIQC